MHDKAAAATSSFSGCFTQATGDFNKDGIRDLVVSNWDVDRITVHLGIGGGFFSAPIVFTEDRPSSLGVADFNQDGSDDFFILLYGTGDIRIMFGDGLGGFTPSGFILGHGGAFGGLVADVNNDNVDDIVVHSRTIQPGSVDGISAFINDGSGSFTRIDSIGGFTYGNLDGRQALAPGDFNGDGNIDILAGGTTSTNGTVFPFFGDGTGNFTVPPRIETFQRPFSVQAGHFNMDGALDFMVQGIAGGSFATMLGDGAGGFTGPNPVEVLGFDSVTPFGTADLNGDGLDDIVSARFAGVDQFLAVILSIPPEVVTFTSPPGGFSTLLRNPDGTFTRRLKNGTKIDFDVAGLQTSVVDRNGNVTGFETGTFDAATRSVGALGRETLTTRDAGGKATRIVASNGRDDRFFYDQRGNLTSITGAALTQTVLACGDVNCPGVVTGVTRAVGLPEETTTSFAYDLVTCNLTGTTDSLGNPTTFAYGPAGNVVSVTDALLRESRFVYDGLNGTTKSTDVSNSDPAPACGLARVTCFADDAGATSEAEFTAFLERILGNPADFGVDGSRHFVCMDWRHLFELLSAGQAVYSERKNLCVWNKTKGGMGSRYRSKHELVLLFKKGTAAHLNNVELGKHGRYRTHVWDYPGTNAMGGARDEELTMHPTVKPVALVADAIKDCSARGGIVLAAFGGSGTTLIAAERAGRRGRVLELEPRYVDVTLERYWQLTGEESVHAETGLTFAKLKVWREIEGEEDETLSLSTQDGVETSHV